VTHYYDRAGSSWEPTYLHAIDADACIGCGRCYKVCGKGVLGLVQRPADDEDEDSPTTVMAVANAGACIGCGACGRVCAKRAQTYVAA